MKTLNVKQIRELAKQGLTIAVGKEQFDYIREHHYELVPRIKADAAIVGSDKKLKILLTPPELTIYNDLVKVIPGIYHLLDGNGALIAISV